MTPGPAPAPAGRTGDTCPSAPADPGSRLIGLVGADGVVGYVRPSLPVSEAFLAAAGRQGKPTTRFRFAAPCIRSGCQNWRENRCQVVEAELAAAPDAGARGALPACAIRAGCVWFAQRQAAACRLCPRVITDTIVPA